MQTIADKRDQSTAAELQEQAEHAAVLDDARSAESKGKLQKIAIDQCYVADNPRENHDTAPIVSSYLRHGFMLNQPILVAKTDKGFLVVRGNRRYLAACTLRDENPDDFKIIFPQGKIPAVVKTGLSDAEIAIMRLDFDQSADRRSLNGWEMFLAVKLAVKYGYKSETGLAEKLGLIDDKGKPRRSFVQPRVRLAKLPADIQTAFRPVFLPGKNEENGLRQSDIQPLARLFREMGDCDDFRKAFRERLNREKPETPGRKGPKYGITAKELQDRLNTFDSQRFKDFLSALLSDEETATAALVEIDTLLASAEPASAEPASAEPASAEPASAD